MKPLLQSHLQPWNHFIKYTSPMLIGLFFVVTSSKVNDSRFLVKTLPGFLGDIPFTLETGYIGVGENNDVQLFYYFVESEGNPETNPLLLILSGGPGCSGRLLSNMGLFIINLEKSTLKKPILDINPNRWTKVASIIYLDQPAGSGFSYANTPEASMASDTLATKYSYQFLRKWLVDHPKFLENPLYVFADSYAGILLSMVVKEIYNGNEVGEEPQMNIKGYVLGNPVIDTIVDYNSKIPYAHRMALLSDAIYKSAEENCQGEYLNVDPNNSLCKHDLQVVNKCVEKILPKHVLMPTCGTSNSIKSSLYRRGLRSLHNTTVDILLLPDQVHIEACRQEVANMYLEEWANSKDVREALHIREEFNETMWVQCNGSLEFYYNKEPISYIHDVWSTISYHRYLADKNGRALIYSGDHDMIVPYMGTFKLIESLNLLVVNDWRPWFISEQVIGYTIKYSNQNYNLTFATVKGGGHIVAEYKPKEWLTMLTRWLANDVL